MTRILKHVCSLVRVSVNPPFTLKIVQEMISCYSYESWLSTGQGVMSEQMEKRNVVIQCVGADRYGWFGDVSGDVLWGRACEWLSRDHLEEAYGCEEHHHGRAHRCRRE